LAAATALLLSAVQALPSAELTRLSGRAASAVPRTAYEIPNRLLSDASHFPATGARWTDGLTCRRLEPGTHHEHVYHFSVGPWRLAEYVWPNFSGRQFPTNRRWLEVIPGEGRVWVPSLYMGLFPLVLAMASMRLRRGDLRESWLSWLVVLSVAASFGWYGLGWLVHEVRAAAGGGSGPGLVGAPFGGLYWLMTVLLPGYGYFRYPAKLLVIAALGLSMLSARGWDQAFTGRAPRLGRALTWLVGISLCGAIAVLVVFPFREPWLGRVEPDVLFGPLDKSGACLDLLLGFLQTALLCGLFWWLLRRTARGARWLQTAALVLVAVDLAVANGWMVVCAPADNWQRAPTLAAVIEQDRARRGDDQPYRVLRAPIWLPPAWSDSASPERIPRSLQWDRQTLFAKHNLGAGIPIAEVQGTMKPYDYQVSLWVRKRGRGSFSRAEKSCVPFFAEYLVLPGNDRMPDMEPIALEGTDAEGLEDVSLWHNPGGLPRAWIVHQVDVLPPLDSADPYQLWQRTEAVFCPEGCPRDLRKSAIVEGEGATFAFSSQDAGSAGVGHLQESCRVVRYEPSRVEIEAELERPGLVVLCDQFYPGWRLEVETAGQGTREAPILRTNRMMRGAWLPAGRHRLTYRYRPAAFLWGAWLSGLGWIGLGIGLVVTGFTRSCAGRLRA
jgi:hypothetical protein